jgi:hypothetical protein
MTAVPDDSNRGKEMPMREFPPRARVDWSLVHGLRLYTIFRDSAEPPSP